MVTLKTTLQTPPQEIATYCVKQLANYCSQAYLEFSQEMLADIEVWKDKPIEFAVCGMRITNGVMVKQTEYGAIAQFDAEELAYCLINWEADENPREMLWALIEALRRENSK